MGIETPVCQLFECPRIRNWKWTPMPTGILQAIDHLPSIPSDIHWNRAFVLIPSPRLSVSTAMESCIHPHPVPSPLCQHRPSISTLALQLPLLVAPLHLPTPDSPSSSNTPEWGRRRPRGEPCCPFPTSLRSEPVHLRQRVVCFLPLPMEPCPSTGVPHGCSPASLHGRAPPR